MNDSTTKKQKIIVIAGPTAVGKTSLAIEAACDFNAEIVSADSMQIYKYMDIGSAKPTASERAAAVHWLVDEIDPATDYSAAEYRRQAGAYIHDIAARGRNVIISGGTGLYINSLIYNMDFSSSPADSGGREELRRIAESQSPEALYEILKDEDPAAAARIHPNNVKKVIRAIEAARSGHPIPDFENSFVASDEFEPLIIILDRDRQELYDRINLRVDLMLSQGLVDEIKGLMDRGLRADSIAMKGIGYKEMIAYLDGEYDYETAVELVKRNSRRYAKRQLTWFRRYPDARWFSLSADADGEYGRIKELIEGFLYGCD